MNKRTGLAFIILTTTLAACTAQAAPVPTTTPTPLPDTPTAQPTATARPTAMPTVTPTPLSPDAQALKDIVFSDCIPVEEVLAGWDGVSRGSFGTAKFRHHILCESKRRYESYVTSFREIIPEGENHIWKIFHFS